MKINIINYFFALACCFTLFACEAPIGEEYRDGGNSLSFQVAKSSLLITPDSDNQIKIPINRTSMSGDHDINVVLTYPEGSTQRDSVFSLVSDKVSFKNGEGLAYATITFDKAGLDFTAYNFGLRFNNTLKSPSGIDSTRIQVQRRLTWKSLGTGSFASEAFEDTWPVEVQQAEEDLNRYRIVDCYQIGFPFIFTLNADNSLSFSSQETGVPQGDYGMMSLIMPAIASPNQPYKDGKTIHLWGRLVVSAGSFGEFHEVLTLP